MTTLIDPTVEETVIVDFLIPVWHPDAVSVRLYWICPGCGKPRGRMFLYDSRDMRRSCWFHTLKPCPCGYHEKFSILLEEARSNGLNPHLANVVNPWL